MPLAVPASKDNPVLTRALRSLERRLAKSIDRIVADIVRKGDAAPELFIDFGDLTARAMAFVDLVARERMIEERNATSPAAFSRSSAFQISERDLPDYLQLPFVEAIEDFAARDPVLAGNAPEVANAYSKQRFAIARSSRIEFTEQVKKKLLEAQRKGLGVEKTINLFRREKLGDAYAETVFRTNLKTATTAGRVKMAQDPDLGGFIVAWAYAAVVDGDTRSTHLEMDGRVFEVTHPIWKVWMTPNGYNCRCALLEVTRPDAEDRGLFDAGGRFKNSAVPSVLPDPGFRQSPVTRVYAA